jgi:hypothetical protein
VFDLVFKDLDNARAMDLWHKELEETGKDTKDNNDDD